MKQSKRLEQVIFEWNSAARNVIQNLARFDVQLMGLLLHVGSRPEVKLIVVQRSVGAGPRGEKLVVAGCKHMQHSIDAPVNDGGGGAEKVLALPSIVGI